MVSCDILSYLHEKIDLMLTAHLFLCSPSPPRSAVSDPARVQRDLEQPTQIVKKCVSIVSEGCDMHKKIYI